MAESQATSLRGNYTPLAIGWSIGMICAGFALSALFNRLGKSTGSIGLNPAIKEGKVDRGSGFRSASKTSHIKKQGNAGLRALKRVQNINV